MKTANEMNVRESMVGRVYPCMWNSHWNELVVEVEVKELHPSGLLLVQRTHGNNRGDKRFVELADIVAF